MDWRARVVESLREITGDAARDADIVEELAEHLAQRYAELLAGGATPEDATACTLAEFRQNHNLARAIRRADRARGRAPLPPPTSGRRNVLADLTKDLKYGARLLAKNPGFAAAAILTLGLGIGASTAIFSVVNAVILRPIPFAEPRRLMAVWETDRNSGTTREPASVPDFLDFQQRSRQFATLAAFAGGETNFTPNDGAPTRLAALGVSHEFLPLLGIRPAVGRNFTREEDRPGNAAVAVISDRLWDRLFQRREVIGKTIRLNDRERTIIGVMPRDADFGVMQVLSLAAYGRAFADRDMRSRVDVWLPLQADSQSLPRSTHPIFVLGRLAHDATRSTAQQEIAAIMADLERDYPENRARGAFVEAIPDVVFGRVRPALWTLLGAVGVVLLIACVNVANLLLARGTVRAREVAVRTALGAASRRLARQFAAENLVLTSAAAVLGVALAFAGLRVLLTLAPADVPRLAAVSIDARVLGVALGVAVITGLTFGLVPVLQARRLDVQGALKSEDSRSGTAGRDRGLLRSTLVVAEIALACVLVVGAGLLIKSFWRLQQVDAGFDPRGVVKAEFQLPASRYPTPGRLWPNFAEMHRFNRELLRRVQGLPGVEAAAIAGSHPLDAGFTNSFSVVGREAEGRNWPEISVRRVTPEYFATVRLALTAGRLLGDADDTQAPAVGLINQTAARAFFEGRDPLGQQIQFWGSARTVVGVVANERFHGLTASSPPAIYLPMAQAPSFGGGEVLLARTNGATAGLLNGVRTAIGELDRALPVFGLEPLEETVSESIGQRRFVMLLLVLFAALALTLAAIGIHGVLSYTVAQRRHEIGIRMALGAPPQRVTRLVLGRGAWLTGLGIVIGFGGALVVTRLLTSLLFDVTATDAATILIALPILAGVAMAAAYFPARRAVRTDPLAALRQS